MVEIRGRVDRLSIENDFVEDASRNPTVERIEGFGDRGVDLIDPRPVFGRNENDLGVVEELKAFLNLLGEIFLGFAFGVEVPFIHEDHNRFLAIDRVTHDVRVLLNNAR
jgi:hypothetical protein